MNLLGTEDNRETTELTLYYPLSPSLSCLISPKEYGICSADIPSEVVEELNDLIAWESNDFLVANSDRVLQHIVKKPRLTRPPTCRILDS